MVCRNCRTVNPDNVQRCTRCGYPLYGAGYNYGYNNGTYGRGYYNQPKVSQPGEGFAIASMILGIAGLALCVSIVPCVLALIFGLVARSHGNRSGMATAGIVCGAIGAALGIIGLILYFAGIASMMFYVNNPASYYYY